MIEISPRLVAAATGAQPWRVEMHCASLIEAITAADVLTTLRVAHFLAQVAHESSFFARTEENLRYSADALLRVFPRRFKELETAARYALQPERIANRVYADRLGNGSEESGDGWRYRGMGLIQLTGKANHDAYWAHAKAIGAGPDALAGPPHAALSAGWFWAVNGVNALADADDVEAVTRLVNGGTHGLAQRRALTERAKAALA